MTTRAFDLEKEHKELMGKLNIQDYTLSRIPRPGESQGPKNLNKDGSEGQAK